MAVVYAPAGEAAVQRIILAGLGPAEQFEIEKLKNAAAFALRKCREIGINRPGIPVSAFEGFPCELSSCTVESLLREGLTGAMAGLHRFNEMKTKNSDVPQSPESILLLCDADPGPVLRETAALAQSEVAGIVLARDLTISPANRVTPGFIAETASEIAAKFGFKIEIIDLDSARSMGMGAL